MSQRSRAYIFTTSFVHCRDARPCQLDQVLVAEVVQKVVDALGRSGDLHNVDVMRLAVEDLKVVLFLHLEKLILQYIFLEPIVPAFLRRRTDLV